MAAIAPPLYPLGSFQIPQPQAGQPAPTIRKWVVNPEVGHSSLYTMFQDYGNNVETLDRLFYLFIPIAEIAHMNGAPEAQNAANTLAGAKHFVSVSRGLWMLVKLFSGGVTHTYHEVPAVYKQGVGWVPATSKEEYAHHQPDGTFAQPVIRVAKTRDLFGILCDVALLVARILNPLLWLHKMKLINLGEHSKGVGIGVGCAFSAVTLICLIDSIKELVQDLNRNVDIARIKRDVAEVLSNIIDTLKIPYDSFCFEKSPGAALAFAIIAALSSLVWLAKEAIYH